MLQAKPIAGGETKMTEKEGKTTEQKKLRPWDIELQKLDREKISNPPPIRIREAKIIEDVAPFLIGPQANANPRAEIPTLEFPIYSLSKHKSLAIKRIEARNGFIEIVPGQYGQPTIWDRDILLFILGELARASDYKQSISNKVKFYVADYLKRTGRSGGGRSYTLLKDALMRLHTTSIRTDMKIGGKLITDAFHLIESFQIIDPLMNDEKRISIEVSVNQWSMTAVLAKEILSINPAYYKMQNPTKRRLYEIARKGCGGQNSWKIGLSLLHARTGTKIILRDFRYDMKKISKSNDIPDYSIEYDETTDMITFSKKSVKADDPETKELELIHC